MVVVERDEGCVAPDDWANKLPREAGQLGSITLAWLLSKRMCQCEDKSSQTTISQSPPKKPCNQGPTHGRSTSSVF